MSAQRIDEVELVEVGKYYLVPTCRYPWKWFGERAWPVIGSRHEDAQFIGFHWWHYHIDGRFVSRRIWRSLEIRDAARSPELHVVGSPLAMRDFSRVRPDPRPHPPLVWRRRRCVRAFLVPPELTFPKLHAEYSGEPCLRVNGALICPHKGARLTMPPDDENGILICPLHGLRIDVKTERVKVFPS